MDIQDLILEQNSSRHKKYSLKISLFVNDIYDFACLDYVREYKQ